MSRPPPQVRQKNNSKGPSVSSPPPTGGSTAPQQRKRPPRPDALPGGPTYVYNSLKDGRTFEYYRGKDKNLFSLRRLAIRPVLGFDIEWKPNWGGNKPPNPVALVQLSSEDDVALIQVSTYPTGKLPPLLQEILENPAIMKVGVGIYEDAEKVERDMNISMQNMLDLSAYAQNVDPYWKMKAEAETEAKRLRDVAEAEKAAVGVAARTAARAARTGGGEKMPRNVDAADSSTLISLAASEEPDGSDESDDSDLATPTLTPTTPQATPQGEKRKEPKLKQFGPQKAPALGLARLAAHYLSFNLPKPKAVSRSNWELNPLRERQLIYAANDAAVGLDTYEALEKLQNTNHKL